MKIVTGHTGENHITSDDDRGLYAGIFGKESYVLNTGTKLAHNIESSNTIRLYSGDIVHQGTHARIPYGEYTDVTIDNGQSGFNRADLIVARYKKEAGIESVDLVVIKGSPASGNPVDPEHITGNILEGADESDFPLYRVTLNGVNIQSVTPLFSIATPFCDIYPKSKVDSDKASLAKSIGEVSAVANNAQQDAKNAQQTANSAGSEAVSAKNAANEAQGKADDVSNRMNENKSKYSSYSTQISDAGKQIASASTIQTLSSYCAILANHIADLLNNLN